MSGGTPWTPGPWSFDGPPDNIIVWSGPEDRVCFMTSNGPAEANARLIAAAPDLLEAAERLFSALEGYVPADEARALARKAFAKARGDD